MRWPWVGRAALDVALAEVAHLREENGRLLDHVQRIQRLEHGVGEVPREPRKAEEVRMPDDLREYCDGFATPHMRSEQRRQFLRAHAAGVDWQTIRARMMPAEEEPEADGQPAT